MRIAILEAGTPPGGLAERHGRYDAMVRTLLGPTHDYTTFRVFEGDLPDDPAAFDAQVITGSSAGVHDGLAWIEPLTAYLRGARGRTKLIGICFGHQIMAHAFGGAVAKAPQGWGLGLHHYRVGGEHRAVIASHQDQVTVAPPGATLLGGSGFTPNAMLDYGDAISLQCHPEFTRAFARDLMAAHAARDITAQARAAAIASLDAADDNARLQAWIMGFLAAGSSAIGRSDPATSPG